MRMSDMIAQFIMDTLSTSEGEIELKRNELADRFNCVPSQINYVISTRFSPEHGYIVQSRRGGGGYIRISRINVDRPSMIMHTVNSIGESLDLRSAAAILTNLVNSDSITAQNANMLMAALSDNALAPIDPALRGVLRARIFKLCLISLVNND